MATAEQYLVCPISKEVCGADRVLTLATPGLFENLVWKDPVITEKHIPPQHVCTYTLRIDQSSSPADSDVAGWMTQVLVKRPEERAVIENTKLSADLFWFTRDPNTKDLEVLEAHQKTLLGKECS